MAAIRDRGHAADVFNNREIAIALWLLVFLFIILLRAEIRQSFSAILKGLFATNIMVLIFLMFAYAAGVIFIMSSVSLWNVSLLKDTILWVCLTGFLITFKFCTARKGQLPFKEFVKGSISIMVVLEFIVNTYTFSLGIELTLVPVISVLVLLESIAQHNEQYLSVAKFINKLEVLFGVVVILYVTRRLASDLGRFGSMDTVRNNVLAPLLTLGFMPFTYFVALYAAYELVFVGLHLGTEKSSSLRWYAKKEIFKHCHANLKRISRLTMGDLMSIKNRKDVTALLQSRLGGNRTSAGGGSK